VTTMLPASSADASRQPPGSDASRVTIACRVTRSATSCASTSVVLHEPAVPDFLLISELRTGRHMQSATKEYGCDSRRLTMATPDRPQSPASRRRFECATSALPCEHMQVAFFFVSAVTPRNGCAARPQFLEGTGLLLDSVHCGGSRPAKTNGVVLESKKAAKPQRATSAPGAPSTWRCRRTAAARACPTARHSCHARPGRPPPARWSCRPRTRRRSRGGAAPVLRDLTRWVSSLTTATSPHLRCSTRVVRRKTLSAATFLGPRPLCKGQPRSVGALVRMHFSRRCYSNVRTAADPEPAILASRC